MNDVGALDWFRIGLSAINILFLGGLFVARLQVKNWFLEQKEATQSALDAHNEDPGAHNNHSIAVGLEQKFGEVMEKIGRLTTELAVLNERLRQQQTKGGRGGRE